MSNRQGPEILFSDINGDNQITTIRSNAPYPIPRPQSDYGVELATMQPGEDGPGFRTFQLTGNDVSYQDVEFQFKLLTPDQFDWFDSRFNASTPAPFRFSMDGGSSWKSAVYQQKGWEPRNWTSNWEKSGGAVRLHVTGAM